MDNKASIYADLETLTRMCRSKNDGASLRIEEDEIKDKIQEIDNEITEINQNTEEELYDSSAEMADRNIQIILKKVIQNLKNELKNKNNELNELKDKEVNLNNQIKALTDRIDSNGLFIETIKSRLSNLSNGEAMAKYQSQLSTTEQEIAEYNEELTKLKEEYSSLQDEIEKVVSRLETINKKLKTKEEQLEETEQNLSNRDSYIDINRKDKNDKKINELTAKKKTLQEKLDTISDDPKYLELKIKEVIAKGQDIFDARPYLNKLVAKAIEVPYMDRNLDNSLEEELLHATQERDNFASTIEQKDYSVMAMENPEQIRITYLNKKIENWNKQIEELQEKASIIDGDTTYNYGQNITRISDIINNKKKELADYEQQYKNEAETNMSKKASLKLMIEEDRNDLKSAEEILSNFKTEQSKEIEEANLIISEKCAKLNNNIAAANAEIKEIQSRLGNKKTGLIDINAQNNDREKLKELAKVVVDIKHRRQFTESPRQIASRLEQNLSVSINTQEIEQSKMENKEEPIPEEKNVKVEEPIDTQTEVLEQTETQPAASQVPEESNELDSFLTNLKNTVESGE